MTWTTPLPEGFTSLRPEQTYAIDRAVDAFVNGAKTVVVDAPPGVGKTLLGEMVRLGLGSRGIYLCTSKHLQNQFISDFPYASLLKGRSNYPTERFPEDFDRAFQAVSCADCSYSKDRDCELCFSKNTCPYEVAKGEALSSQLVCTNTSYFLAESNGPGRFSGWPLVVLDECDLLEDEVLRSVQLDLGPRVRKWLGVGWPSRKTVQGSWVKWFEKVIPQVEAVLELHAYGTEPQEVRDANRIRGYLSKMRMAQEGVKDGTWVYDGYDQGRIQFVPVKVDQMGTDRFWRHGVRFLCMSGTVGSGTGWLEEAGYRGTSEILECDSPYDVGQREIRIAPVAYLTYQNKEETWPVMRDAVRRVMDLHPDERILVHTHSYALANYLFSELNDLRVMTYLGSDTKDNVVKWFEETDGAVLLAPSLERGYDGADEKVRVIVVCKVPFPSLGSKRVSGRLYGRGWDGQRWYQGKTARSLMQMTSRGVRHENDWCVTYILDAAFVKFYRDAKVQLSRWWRDAVKWNGPWRKVIEGGS